MGHLQEFLRNYVDNAPSVAEGLDEIEDALELVRADLEDDES